MLNHHREKLKNTLIPIALVSAYLLFVSFYYWYLSDQHLLLSIRDVTASTLRKTLLQDAVPLVFGLYMVLLGAKLQKKTPRELGILIRRPAACTILAAVYAGIFLISREFSASGLYAFFYYLIAVAFTEELIFRAYLFTSLEKAIGTTRAIVVSGALWGAAHSVISIAVYSQSVLFAALSALGGCVLGSFVFVFLFKKSQTLYVPTFAHAILDYAGFIFA